VISLSCGGEIDVVTGGSSLDGVGDVSGGLIFVHPVRTVRMMSKKVIWIQPVKFPIDDDLNSNTLFIIGKTRRRIMPPPHLGLFEGGFLCLVSWLQVKCAWKGNL
jgi:hypothetical protein